MILSKIPLVHNLLKPAYRPSAAVQRILGSDKSTINVAAARNLVVSLVYPMNKNKAVLGFNYRNSAEQFPVIQEMLQTGRETMAAPVDLVQGGRGIILRAPGLC